MIRGQHTMVARNHANPTIQRNHANQRDLILLIKGPKGLDVSNIHPPNYIFHKKYVII